jgi:hypothetical protein
MMKLFHEFITNGKHPIAKNAFPEMDLSMNTGTLAKHIHLVLTTSERPKIIYRSVTERFDGTGPTFNFNELARTKSKLEFSDCLILCSCYQSIPKERLKRIITTRLTASDAAVAHILGITNGYLILSHQFEQIASLIFEIPPEQAKELRKNFNKQRLDLYHGLAAKKVKNFEANLKKHCITHGLVFHPAYLHANSLFEFLIK